MKKDQEKSYQIIKYEDDSMIIRHHNNWNQTASRPKFTTHHTRVKNEEFPYMPIKQYKRTLKRKRFELYNFKLVNENCAFITLTYEDTIDWTQLNRHFRSFIQSINRAFQNTKYIRTFEFAESDFRLHIHIIIVFDSKKPKEFNQYWISKYWNHGFAYFKHVCDSKGLINYFTEFDSNCINPIDPNFTKFPQFVKIISHSTNMPKLEQIIEYADKNKKNEIVQEFIKSKEQRVNKRTFNFIDGHYLLNKNTGEMNFYTDNEFLH